MFSVLVLCTGNSARSQIAEALFVARGAARVTARSAGSRPAARVNPYAEATLGRHGIPWEGRVPTHLDALASSEFDLVITVCDNARDACPYFPGGLAQVHWGLPDPAEESDPERAHAAFEATFEALDRRVAALLSLPLESMTSSELSVAAQSVHDRNLSVASHLPLA